MPEVFNAHTDKTHEKVSHAKPTMKEKKRKKAIGPQEPENKVHRPLAAYCYYPAKVRFVNKDPEEKVVLLLRRHPITNVPWIITAIFLIFAPSFLTVMPFFDSLPPQFRLISVVIWYLVTLAFIFEQFLSWYFQVNIVTDERIIDVDFVNLLYREITDADIDQIQDVTVTIGGASRTFFNYGNILVQTAAEIPNLEFMSVPKPDEVARILRELRVEEEIEKLEGRIR